MEHVDQSNFHRIGPGPYPNVLDIPTPPLQRAGVFVMFVFPAIATVVYSMRVYIRVTMRTFGLDDFLCGLALISDILVCATLFMFFKLNYYGWRDEDVPEYDPSAGLWWNFFEQLCYNPVLAFVKCSILVFLLRLGGHNNAVYWTIWGLIYFTIGHAISVFFGALFQCVPIYTNWHPEMRNDPDTRCIDLSFHIIQSSLTILTDVLILALPFYIFLRLKMARGAKIALCGIFAIGLLVPIVAIVRLVNIYNILYNGERSVHYSLAYVWTAVEVNLAVICCSMPSLRPLFSRWFPKLFDLSQDKSSGEVYGSANLTVGGSQMPGAPPRSNHRERTSMNYMLRDLHPSRMGNKGTHTEIRGTSPTGSEDEIMTYNGILRTTNVNVSYEDKETKRSDTSSHLSTDIP
ncbi:hypothetical protein B0I35DRAFT_515158 [Stachybotrys elegans]|uniref:Rhodopsin domain-containing protein n=1 Tax=Stachybotrys elegans TaxID=80388 RepID=A0A8K0SJF0_9HYPO|nr:hypothetical protein B0I35DRAFT_515158 [Stachybotrys elegans]